MRARADAFSSRRLACTLRVLVLLRLSLAEDVQRVKKELLDAVKARKLAYYGHTMRKQGSCLEKEIMQGTMSGARRRARPRTAWMDVDRTLRGRVYQNVGGQR